MRVRSFCDSLKDPVRHALVERLELMRATLSPRWSLLLFFGFVTCVNLLLSILFSSVTTFYPFLVLTLFLSWSCAQDVRRKRAQFGGQTFFGVLRNQQRHDAHVREARHQARMHAGPDSGLIIRRTLSSISLLSGEPRAYKVAQKAKRASDPIRLLRIIADNAVSEPKSAKLARQGLKDLNRM